MEQDASKSNVEDVETDIPEEFTDVDVNSSSSLPRGKEFADYYADFDDGQKFDEDEYETTYIKPGMHYGDNVEIVEQVTILVTVVSIHLYTRLLCIRAMGRRYLRCASCVIASQYATSIVNRCWSGFPCKWRYINVETFNLLTFYYHFVRELGILFRPCHLTKIISSVLSTATVDVDLHLINSIMCTCHLWYLHYCAV